MSWAMADMFINSVCRLVMISGEAGSEAPYAGISAQIDVMQEFMEGDMMLALGDIPDAPEILELKMESNKDDAATNALNTLEFKLMPGTTYPIFRGGISPDDSEGQTDQPTAMNVTQIVQELTRQFDTQSRGDPPEGEDLPQTAGSPKTWGFGTIAPILVAVATVISHFGEQICRGIGVIMPGLSRIAGAVAKHSPQVARIIAKLSPAAAVGLTPLILGFSEKFKTIATVLGTVAQMVSEFMQTYMMVKQFQSLNDYARYLSPEVGAFLDTTNSVEDMISAQYEQGTVRNISMPGAEPEGVGRGTTTPTDPTKQPSSVTRPFGFDKQEFTLNTGLRVLVTQQMPMFEALLKKLILSLNSKIDPVDGPAKVYSITDILYNSLNYAPPKGSTGVLGGPPHEWSLAEILSKGIPVIEHIDPLTKKKTEISVLEIIMQAQGSKVVELGPGFLKWYTDIDVLQHNDAVVSTPKTGI